MLPGIRAFAELLLEVARDTGSAHDASPLAQLGDQGSDFAILSIIAYTMDCEIKRAYREMRDDTQLKSSTANDGVQVESKVLMHCFRSLNCQTYSFLDEDVAKCLASIVESEWDPMALIKGDLERRRSIEKASKVNKSKAVLSKTMSDNEVKEMASGELGNVPGWRKQNDLINGNSKRVFIIERGPNNRSRKEEEEK
ncbi:hypothetical protein PC129_g4427 [Phytophthora cactorum]|uniref:Uncharacterized protein n=1 Tax=Phytophthora cactorum TaxID=29920 RepID=A0A8T1E1L9_9STRA|nr:hypothetical protein PC117_g8796 [Phytophthora cactorum]KAG3224950.1 hypothetical protein PC129_g4427 [Phytophthora cactorum]